MASTGETALPGAQAIQDLDIAAKQHRNATLPISRVPPEVLAQMMAESLDFMVLDYPQVYNNTTHTHPAISLSQVSSSWREVAFQSHELWSRIQIQMFTHPSLLEHIWQNTGSMLIDLEFCGSDTEGCELPRAFTAITRILHNELGRIKTINAFCKTAVSRAILSEMTGRCDSLESLSWFGVPSSPDDPLPIDVGLQFLSGGAPKLRFIEPMTLFLPWASRALISPFLTHAKFWYTDRDMEGLFGFLKQASQLEVLEVHNLPFMDEAFRPHRFTVVGMPNLKELYLGNGGDWRSVCTALSTIRMPLDRSQERNLTVFCGCPLEMDGDSLSDAYIRILVEFFGGHITPEEIELCQEGEHGWEAVKVWTTSRFQVPDYASAALGGEPSVVFEDRPEWVQLGFGRTSPFDPALDHQSLWSLGGLRAITLRTCYWASELSPQFWSMLGNLGNLEVVTADAERVITQPLFKEFGQSDGNAVGSPALSFPSLRVIVLCYGSVPSGPVSSADTDGSEQGEEEDGYDGKTELDYLLEDVSQAFKNRGGRQLDEFKLAFSTCVGAEDKDIVRSALMDLESGGIARRVGVWDFDGEITWDQEVPDPIDYSK